MIDQLNKWLEDIRNTLRDMNKLSTQIKSDLSVHQDVVKQSENFEQSKKEFHVWATQEKNEIQKSIDEYNNRASDLEKEYTIEIQRLNDQISEYKKAHNSNSATIILLTDQLNSANKALSDAKDQIATLSVTASSIEEVAAQ